MPPGVRRGASVTALSTLTALKISEPKFKAITANNAKVWQALAMIIAMNVGFSGSLIVGAVLYVLVAALAFTTWPKLLTT